MKCLNCGAEIKNDLGICPYCGKDMQKTKEELELEELELEIKEKAKELTERFKIYKEDSKNTTRVSPFAIIIFIIIACGIFFLREEPKDTPTTNNNKPVTQTVQTVQQITESDVYAQNISKAGVIIIDNAVQKTIQKEFSEGLEFYSFAYSGTCVDPMKVGLFTYKNKFEGKVSKKEHSYSFRVGTNKLINNGIPKLYYLSVDGETWYFDENGEDKFISASDKALKKALQQK